MKNKEAISYLESVNDYIHKQYFRKNTTMCTKWFDRAGTALLKAIKLMKQDAIRRKGGEA